MYDEHRKRLTERYGEARSDLHASSGWRKWKALTPAQRWYIGGGIIFVVMLVVYLVTSYWDVPQVPNPSGEGG